MLASGAAALVGGLASARGATGPTAHGLRGHGAPVTTVIRDRRLLIVCAMLFLGLAALYGPLAWVPPFMEDVAGMPEAERSLAGVVMALAAIPPRVPARDHGAAAGSRQAGGVS